MFNDDYNLTLEEFTNIYFTALRRMDKALLKKLGLREEFLVTFDKDWSGFTFLKSKILRIEKKGQQGIVVVSVIVCTAEEEIMKIHYQLVLQEGEQGLAVADFQEVKRTVLLMDHPENPLNYRVFCSVYAISSAGLIRNWLESNPDIFLTGEFAKGDCYKLLKVEDCPRQCFDVTAGIVSEFILTKHELIIYAPQAAKLAGMEFLLARDLKKGVVFQQKYYLPVRELYKTVISGASLERLLQEEKRQPNLHSFQAFSAFICWKSSELILDYLRKEATEKQQLDRETWYFIKERRKTDNQEEAAGFIEYYVSGNWVRINAYNEDLEKELKRFRGKVELIQEEALQEEDAERKWKIYKLLNLMAKEAPSLKEMGIVPSVKAIAWRLGSVSCS